MRSGSPRGYLGKQRAARLRDALRRRGVRKLYGLALDLGVDQSTISRWTHEGRMSLDHAAALCAYLEITLDWLVLGRGSMELPGHSDTIAAFVDRLASFEPELAAAFLIIANAIHGST